MDIKKAKTLTHQDNRLIGRALLWDFDSYKIMDRIYTICDEDLSFYFKQWATKNGYLYKSEQNWFNTIFFEQIGTGKKEFKLEVKLPNIKQHYYPYMDTFLYYDAEQGRLSNSQIFQRPYAQLDETEGEPDWRT